MPTPNPSSAPISQTDRVFDLPEHLIAKNDPDLIADDTAHFASIAANLRLSLAHAESRLDELRRSAGGKGRRAVDRDMEIHQLSSRIRTLRRFRLDVCLGRLVGDNDSDNGDDGEPVYVGRLGLTDAHGETLLIDWRTPLAAPFFAATHRDPMGLVSRRRYRWTHGRITDYWDEVFVDDPAVLARHAALDDQSAFIADLGASRSPRMRDVLGTIATDQDAIIRAGSHGVLVVDGGPGTGKTVVALHRAAYLVYADPRLAGNRGGLLVVGPHRPYLAYVADVLPSLGEESVQTCTLVDLVVEGARAVPEVDDEVAQLKSSARMVSAIEPAVRFYEQPPTTSFRVETPWAEITLTATDWADAFDAPERGTPHNDARDEVWEELVSIIADRHDDDVPYGPLRRALAANVDLMTAFSRAWPILDAAEIVGDLWSVPAYLRMCAPWLTPAETAALQRTDPAAWTDADLPLLDAARQRIGDPEAPALRRTRQAELDAGRERIDQVVEDLIAAEVHDDGEGVMSMLRHENLRDNLGDGTIDDPTDTDRLAGPYAHVIVDEAQELTDAQWQMLLSRCPSKSFTVVGDRAQARRGFVESWAERLRRVGFDDVTMAGLTINYRTPEEIMDAAAPVIRAALPDANVPTSVRSTGIPVTHRRRSELDDIVHEWTATHPEGTACVIGEPGFAATDRVRSLTPTLAKGLEFDLVVLVDPDSFGAGIEGAVDRYVSMTRATQQLVILDT
ncbi:RNA polymerase recycling motor ATPase HelR [Gordonia sp. 'Campus']|uniref:RNA polymerase recycling motor ATPase HelR n=1 Tax=Gordonia sp. 'Campus' TaxID=2915824 RepID=UPI001EE47968|nr:RNA polymerase recycling motor ATPase HelR [Gordonia sp. 'Campus']